jgi:hypothetical protein
MADWILFPGLTDNVAFAEPESSTKVTTRIAKMDLLIMGLNPFFMFTRMLKQYKMVIVKGC